MATSNPGVCWNGTRVPQVLASDCMEDGMSCRSRGSQRAEVKLARKILHTMISLRMPDRVEAG